MPSQEILDAFQQIQREHIEKLETLCQEHDSIEGELIDLARMVLDGTATPLETLRILDLWHNRHNPLEWQIILAFARLPKPVSDKIRSGEE